MAIIVNPNPPPLYIPSGRVGFTRDAKRLVDSSTRDLVGSSVLSISSPLGSAETAFVNRGGVHQHGLPVHQHTGRAHQVSDQNIQLMICDYLNGAIDYWTFLDRVSSLFLTSWIDVVVTPRLARIWYEWTRALFRAHVDVAASGQRRLAPADVARNATRLAELLSSSLANLRVGHQDTDGLLNQAIAPRLQRGMMDVVGRFVTYATRNPLGRDILSVETSILCHAWGGHFITHPPPVSAGAMVVGNVMLGFGGGAGAAPFVLISEDMPTAGFPFVNGGGRPVATVVRPVRYPGTSTSAGRACYRITRPAMQIFALVIVGLALYQLGHMAFRRLF